jgi:Mg-chelatase subunit ChlD
MLCFISLVSVTAVRAQSNQLRPLLRPIEKDDTPQVGDQTFPEVAVEVRVVNEFNAPVRGLDAADFVLSEAQTPVDFALTPLNDAGQPVSLLLLLDISGSMQDQLSPLRQAAILLYDALEQSDESGVIAFAATADGAAVDLTEPIQFAPGRERPFTSDEGALINHINALQVEEDAGAPLFDALFKGVRLAATQAQHEPRAVILITNGRDVSRDGDGMGSRFVTGDMVIEEARRARIPLYTISWNNDADNDYLQRAANFTGGSFYQVFDPSQITGVYDDVVHRLRQRYRLTYQSTLPPDGRRHLLEVTLPHSALPATVQSAFVARLPLTPQIQAVSVQSPGAETAVPLNDAVLQGAATLTPQIVARHGLASVNYYLDGAQVAAHTAGQSPWTFPWDAAELEPGTHTLLVEAVDNADPPHVGVYETAVQVVACGMLCRGEQLLGFNPLFLLGAVLVVSFSFAVLLWNGRSGRPERKPASSPSPQPSPVPRPAIEPFPSGAEEADAASGPQPVTAATARKEPDDRGDKTEVLSRKADRMVFLIDVHSKRNYRLETAVQIGAAARNDIVLDDPALPAHCATIRLENGHYVLQAAAGDTVRVNDAPASQQILLQNGDQIRIGSRLFVFKVVK